MLNYRSFLARNANRTIEEIRLGEVDFEDPVTPMEQQNLIRALNAQIIGEAFSLVEALAAVSMNPEDSPEQRAKQILTFRNHQIREFYESFDENTDLDWFADVFSYPDIDDLDIAAEDEPYYRAYMEGNLEAYREFFLIAKDVWNLLKDSRNKITHGFFLLFNEDQQLITEYEEPVEFPDSYTDYLATADWDSDEEKPQPQVLLMGEMPRNTYMTIIRNAAVVQNHVQLGLQRMIENQGEPVFPEIIFGVDQCPAEEPSTRPEANIIEVNSSYNVVLNTEFKERQQDLFEAVHEMSERHG